MKKIECAHGNNKFCFWQSKCWISYVYLFPCLYLAPSLILVYTIMLLYLKNRGLIILITSFPLHSLAQ